MATYYVRPEGNDLNSGLGPATNLAWQTITKALGATGISSGDTLYIAPGTYRNSSGYTLGGTYNTTTYIYGDPTGAQFSGIAPGIVKFSVYTPTDNSAGTSSSLVSGTSKGNLYFKNIYFDAFTGNGLGIASFTDNIVVDSCVFVGARASAASGNKALYFTGSGTTIGITVKNSIILGFGTGINYWPFVVSGTTCPFKAQDNLIIGCAFDGIRIGDTTNLSTAVFGQFHVFTNNTIIGCNRHAIGSNQNQNFSTWFFNNLCIANGVAFSYASGQSFESYNRLINNTVTLSGVQAGGNTVTGGSIGIDIGENLLYGLSSAQIGSIYTGAPTAGLGTAGIGTFGTVPTSDLFGTTWANGSSPDIGAITTRLLANILPTYQPLERNSSSINIVPNSTSQSIELYLGVTGLVYNTSGLVAYYIRNRSSPVQISLVSQTVTGSWVSGGLAEISSSNAPGLYRLDVPNAAFVSGSDDVTIVVRGAAGSNGAIVTCSLFSPTADLLNTQAGIYTASGTLGARLLQTVADNRPVIVTANKQIQIDSDQAFAAGTGATILDPIVNSVGRWTLKGDTMTLFAADGTYLRRVRLAQLGLSLNPS